MRSTSRNGLFTGPKTGGIRARAVGSYLPQLTRKVFEKYGFSTVDLITDWAAIVGDDLARHTIPEKLKWPRQTVTAPDEDASDGASKTARKGGGARARQQGATLVLRVDGARALDIQYQARQLAERINSYFGYFAIGEIRILQAPVGNGPGVQSGGPQPLPKDVITTHKPDVSEVKDVRLKAALERLGAGVMAESARRSRG